MLVGRNMMRGMSLDEGFVIARRMFRGVCDYGAIRPLHSRMIARLYFTIELLLRTKQLEATSFIH